MTTKKKAGPRLSPAARALVRMLIIEGDTNEQIRQSLQEAGHPADIANQSLTYYRQDRDVVASIEQAIAEQMQTGMANRRNRIQRIEHRLNQFNHRLNGTVPSPDDPEEADASVTPTPVAPRTFAMLSDREIKYLVEMDRLTQPNKVKITSTEKDGTVRQEEYNGAAATEVTEQARINDILARYIERTRGKTIEELRKEQNEGM